MSAPPISVTWVSGVAPGPPALIGTQAPVVISTPVQTEGPQGPPGAAGSSNADAIPVALTSDDGDDGLGSAALALGAAAQAQAQAIAQAAAAAAATYAPLGSPAFTGTPTAPTAAPLTDDVQIATTQYVDSAVAAIPGTAAATTNAPAPVLALGLIDDPDDPTNYAGVRNSPGALAAGSLGTGATQTPVITIDRYGCVQAVTNSTITPAWSSVTAIPPVLTTDNIPLAAAFALAFADDWDEPMPSVAAGVFNSQPGVTPGTVGSSTEIPVLTVDAYGRVTSASQTPASGGGGYSQTVQTAATGSSATVTDGTDVLELQPGITFPFAITMDAASGRTKPLYIVDQTGSASPTNHVTVAPAGSDTVRGGTTAVQCVARPYGQAIVTSNQGSPGDFMVLGSTMGMAVFGVSGTWVAPADITWWRARVIGAGGGGGSGGLGVSGTAATGGAGGGCGAVMENLYPASGLPANATTVGLTITVGVAGTVGAAQSTANSNGNAGGAGGLSKIVDSSGNVYALAGGGSGGAAGRSTGVAATGGAPGILGSSGSTSYSGGGGYISGVTVASSSATGGVGSQPSTAGANGNFVGACGSSGGGVTTAPLGSPGAAGAGIAGADSSLAYAGSAGAAQGGNGGNATPFPGSPISGGCAGGSGAGSDTGNGGHAGTSAGYGTGGSGGGAAIGANSSGAGVPGTAGVVVIMCG